MVDKINDPMGVMSEGLPLKSSKHYDVGDGWKLVYTGEEFRRPKSLKRVAISRVEITFDSEKNLNKFLELLKESDDRLSKVPNDEVMYDWQAPRMKDLTVRFGVAWYDKDFFYEKKDVYLSDMHKSIFKKFGSKPELIRVEHIPL
ncbi:MULTISPECIES: hypothetical protein [unclassified Vibrio]|uniref:hypothetical protein n=1 Tax=unclassified Vibrio TaxID=2614977 RepID=UPI0013614B9B|nr:MULTISPECIES: hypothetical protein [unclassified Vibrio]NAW60105.1 hypothetical protein [Vibrio sp. V36_P2S2PM302]NAX26730.1 hypothetical protein [Vibrio sp. V38_P2S17PM301]